MKKIIVFFFLVILISCNKSVNNTQRENEIRDSIILCLEKKVCDSLVLLSDKQLITYSIEKDINNLDMAKDYCNKALDFVERDTILLKKIEDKIFHINKLITAHLEHEKENEIRKNEKSHPLDFLKIYNVNGKHDVKLLKKSNIYISGEICNIASYMGYRNVKCQVLFYNSNDKLVKTSEFIINKFLCHGDHCFFNSTVDAPKFFSSWNIRIIDAYVVDVD